MSTPPPPDDPAALARLDLFADVPAGDIPRLVEGCETRGVEAGEELDVAQTSAACCLVTSGRMALIFEAEEARPRTVSLVEEGDVLVQPQATWTAMAPRLRCRAIRPSRVLLLDRARLLAWLGEPALGSNLVDVLSAHVADRELAVAIALEPRVERRLLLKIRQLADRFGRVTPEGLRLDLTLTHQELADMVGAVRESVTIGLGNLSRQGVIAIRDRTILLRDAAGERAAPGVVTRGR